MPTYEDSLENLNFQEYLQISFCHRYTDIQPSAEELVVNFNLEPFIRGNP